MAVDLNALSSLSTTLSELIDRLGAIARDTSEDDEIAPDLLEVERQLTISHRRLEKTLRQPRRAQRP